MAIAEALQQFEGPDMGQWLNHAALLVVTVGGGVFVVGGMLSATG